MADESTSGPKTSETEPAGRAWRPSGRPPQLEEAGAAFRIVERAPASSPIFRLMRPLGNPLVRVGIGLGLLVAGIIAVDGALDSDWSQRETAPKPTKHAPRAG